MKKLLEPYRYHRLVLALPEKHPFSTASPANFFQLIRLTLRRRKAGAALQAESLYNEGYKALSFGFYQDARKAFERCLALQADHIPALVGDGAAAFHLGLLAEAQARWRAVLQGQPGQTKAWYNLGVLALQREAVDEAADAFRQTLAADPEHFPASCALAEIHFNRREFDSALQLYRSQREKGPWHMAIDLRCAEILQLLDRFEEAQTCLTRVLEERLDPDTQYDLAWLLAVQERELERAYKLFLEADRRKVGFEEAQINAAILASRLDQQEASLRLVRQIANRFSYAPEASDLLLDRLLQANPANHLVRMERIVLLQKRGERNQALALLRTVQQDYPDHLPYPLLLAEWLLEDGAFAEATSVLASAGNRFPQQPEPSALLGLASAQQGDYEIAANHLKRALQHREQPAWLYQLALLNAQLGKSPEARALLERVASLDPQFPRIQQRLRALAEQAGEDQATE
jgi:tetratricopeptide (TPR) repeat protein